MMNDNIEQRRMGKLPSGDVEQPCILTAPTAKQRRQQQREREKLEHDAVIRDVIEQLQELGDEVSDLYLDKARDLLDSGMWREVIADGHLDVEFNQVGRPNIYSLALALYHRDRPPKPIVPFWKGLLAEQDEAAEEAKLIKEFIL